MLIPKNLRSFIETDPRWRKILMSDLLKKLKNTFNLKFGLTMNLKKLKV